MEEIEEEDWEVNDQEAEKRYKERLNYQGLLMQRINSIMIAIDQGYNPYDNTNSLLSILIPEIKGPIEGEIELAKKERDEKLNKIHEQMKLQQPLTIPMKKAFNRKIIETNQNYAWKVVNLVINTLHDMGMLLEEERRLDEGGY